MKNLIKSSIIFFILIIGLSFYYQINHKNIIKPVFAAMHCGDVCINYDYWIDCNFNLQGYKGKCVGVTTAQTAKYEKCTNDCVNNNGCASIADPGDQKAYYDTCYYNCNKQYKTKCAETQGSRVCPYNDPCCFSMHGYPNPNPTTPPGGGGSSTVPGGGSTTNPGNTVPSRPTVGPIDATPIQPPYLCEMCEVDGDGTVSQNDITKLKEKLQFNPNDPFIIGLINFCEAPANNCMGKVIHPAPSGGLPTGSSDKKGLGDCSSVSGPGIKDGITDMMDVDLFRQEFSGEVTTKYCDYNKSGGVDLYDFRDGLYPGFNASN